MSVSPTKAHWGDSVRPSPRSRDQKQVTFELLLPVTQSRARLPMRVMISKHDTTDSIITTVKNFYGLYEGPGVSFQDRNGNILIAAYENFEDGMTVFVKVSEDVPMITDPPVQTSPKKPKLGPPFEMRPPAQVANQTRSPSPVSISASMKGRARSQKSQDVEGFEGFSDSDTGNGSVTSSRRSKAEAHASAEISVDNILEGGRRKRAKFESSELPLFVPPQVPVTNSVSSVSPQRRANGEMASPLPFSNQRTFMYSQPLPSPQSYGRSEYLQGIYGQTLPYNGSNHQLRGRPAMSYQPRRSIGGILPTPEPTVGSVISDEDVALQLMRLGDASNLSHGRTSTSTVDDALSGKAEAASSDEEETDDEDIELPGPRYPIKEEGPQRKKARVEKIQSDVVDSSGDEYNDGSFKGDSDEILPGNDSDVSRRRGSKSFIPPKPRGSMSSMNGKEKKVKKSKTLPSPASGAPSRKTSLGSTQLGPDEEDLSSKPRCQRCRKSKKGCDRQRPCGRCKDAGIGIEGCVSEDEGNGRRGRYGRHMGVVIKKDGTESTPSIPSPHTTPGGTFLTPALPTDKMKSKKRKLPPI
ncbi:Hypothetical protein D9617_14g076250 [Elsinoe fawcettii]|nr:Hypothetical protein D9617_14g076250 [Elsinoe fawcettii]